MRIFVTGASGVIGRRVVPLLVHEHRVTALARTPDKARTLAQAGADTVDVSLFDRPALQRALEGHDVVINLATHMPPSMMRMMLPWSWKENDRVRREGSANVATVARAVGATRLIQESFAPIYEDAGSAWIDERSPVRPAANSRSVLDAEHAANEFTASGGTGVVLRFAAFYSADSPQLHEMLGVARRGWSPLPGRADSYWSSVSCDDAASAVASALTVPAGTYNVTDDEPVTRRVWADALSAAHGLPRLRLMPPWTTALGGSLAELLARSERMSNHKLREASGWTPRWRSVREGFASALGA